MEGFSSIPSSPAKCIVRADAGTREEEEEEEGRRGEERREEEAKAIHWGQGGGLRCRACLDTPLFAGGLE